MVCETSVPKQDRERLPHATGAAGKRNGTRRLAEARRQRRRHQHADHRRRGNVAAAQRRLGSAARTIQYQEAARRKSELAISAQASRTRVRFERTMLSSTLSTPIFCAASAVSPIPAPPPCPARRAAPAAGRRRREPAAGRGRAAVVRRAAPRRRVGCRPNVPAAHRRAAAAGPQSRAHRRPSPGRRPAATRRSVGPCAAPPRPSPPAAGARGRRAAELLGEALGDLRAEIRIPSTPSLTTSL